MADGLDVLFQKGLYAALTGAEPVTALVEGRIFDRVSPGAAFPYVRIGDDSAVDVSTGCHEIEEVTANVHVFSRSVGKTGAKNVARACRTALAGGFPVTGYTVKHRKRPAIRTLDDPDGLTTHAVLTLTFHLSPA